MKFAVQLGATDDIADPGSVAHETEIRGFDALFFPEHTHMPVRHVPIPSAYIGVEERMVRYRRMLNPHISMAWAASATKTLKVGTCVALPAEHDAINLAKTLATLDLMSNGRVVYGFGFGWLEEAMIDHGVDPKRRRKTVRETMLAVKALWTQEQASFSGEIVSFQPCWSWPKPPESRIPILLGAAGTDQVFDHIIEYCDGWMPSQRGDVGDFLGKLDRLKARAADAGRDPRTIQVDVVVRNLSLEKFEALHQAGVQRAILHLPFGDIDEVRRTLDDYAKDFLRPFEKAHPA